GQVETALWSARAGDDGLALLLVDVDGVLSATGMWGHDVGEELLRTVAGRLRGAAGTCSPGSAATSSSSRCATSIRLRGTEIRVRARAGVGVFPADGPDFGDL